MRNLQSFVSTNNNTIWDEAVNTGAIEKANHEIEIERAKLLDLHNMMSPSPQMGNLLPNLQLMEYLSHPDHLDAEEKAESAQVSLLTNKYLGDLMELDDNEIELDPSDVSHEDHRELINTTIGRRRQQLEAHLMELSKRIDAKEELIHQLQVSQERYKVSFIQPVHFIF